MQRQAEESDTFDMFFICETRYICSRFVCIYIFKHECTSSRLSTLISWSQNQKSAEMYLLFFFSEPCEHRAKTVVVHVCVFLYCACGLWLCLYLIMKKKEIKKHHKYLFWLRSFLYFLPTTLFVSHNVCKFCCFSHC